MLPQDHRIFSRHALDLIRRLSPTAGKNLGLLEERFGPLLTFPDGSIMFLTPINRQRHALLWAMLEIPAISERHTVAIVRRMTDKGLRLPGSLAATKGAIRALACFPKGGYSLWYTSDYSERTEDEIGLSVFPIALPGAVVASDELDPSKLLVTVNFRGRVTAATRQGFVAALAAWAAMVAEGGISGEGPARVRPLGVRFRGRWAQFEIDASASGQNTVNWLTLCLLNFGYAVLLVEGIVYCYREGMLLRFEEQNGETIVLSLPDRAAALGAAEKIILPEGDMTFPRLLR